MKANTHTLLPLKGILNVSLWHTGTEGNRQVVKNRHASSNLNGEEIVGQINYHQSVALVF